MPVPPPWLFVTHVVAVPAANAISSTAIAMTSCTVSSLWGVNCYRAKVKERLRFLSKIVGVFYVPKLEQTTPKIPS